jgi:hypothetical protein
MSRHASGSELQDRAAYLLENEVFEFLDKSTSLAGTPPVADRPEFQLAVTDLPDRLTAFGRSSTLNWHVRARPGMVQPTHRAAIEGSKYHTQRVSRPDQSPFFPNYSLGRSFSKTMLGQYGPTGWDLFDSLMLVAPWDDMWRHRATRLYFFNPSLLSDNASLRWVQGVFRFQFEFRQAMWQRLHWIHIGVKELPAEWGKRQTRREQLDKLLQAAWASILKACPPALASTSIASVYLWYEPAFWFVPVQFCHWVPVVQRGAILTDLPTGSVLAAQLPELDREEPLRVQWSGHIPRFVEGIPAELAPVVQGHHNAGLSWLLPAPWRNSTHTPLSWHTRTIGSPGCDFYTDDRVYVAWRARSRRVLRQLEVSGITSDEVLRLLASVNSFCDIALPVLPQGSRI